MHKVEEQMPDQSPELKDRWRDNLFALIQKTQAEKKKNIELLLNNGNMPVNSILDLFAKQSKLGDAEMFLSALMAAYCPIQPKAAGMKEEDKNRILAP